VSYRKSTEARANKKKMRVKKKTKMIPTGLQLRTRKGKKGKGLSASRYVKDESQGTYAKAFVINAKPNNQAQ